MKVIVVGGGAAGMMAAISAGELHDNVILFEKNEKLGKKIYITGKGRCNVTNNADIDTILKNVNRNPKFMYSAIYGFDNSRLYSFIEENGC
ncbi:MAG: NAD(P)/FAD-dependent oxidoreductase, partial [Lachnospiraceae bacterium]|nr:NAD(P)/FAD-dependent oxidoreductase [Lachnospiraceae bacterium]